MYMPEEDRPTFYNLCIIGLFISFLWGVTVYFFKNILLLSMTLSVLCAYMVFLIIFWFIFKCPYCKKNEDIKINEHTSLEPPDYNSSTE